MFPSELATGLCSLNPHVDRLVQSCLMEIDRHGRVVRSEFHDGVINSKERMTYTAVNGILTDRNPELLTRYAPLVPMFEQMRDLFQILNDARRRRGSIDFDLNEAEVIVDEGGVIEAIIALERNVAHRLIEEFMLLANETVASYLEEQAAPSLYRVHEEPDILKVEKFEEFISGFGYSLGAPLSTIRPRHFQKLLERIHGKPEEKPIAFLMLRTMQKARYAPENLGHFGLAAPSYTHFTSPIRRYPDLVVHRALRALRHKQLTEEAREEWAEDLPETARHTSEMERRADDAERELLQWKKVKFMADKVGDEFEGYVTGVAAFGLFIQLIEHYVEGLVHVSTMADDYYRFIEGAHTLRGENTQKIYRLGDKVKVQVIRVNMEVRQIDLGLVEILERVREGERGPRRSKATPKHEEAKRAGRRERGPEAAPKGKTLAKRHRVTGRRRLCFVSTYEVCRCRHGRPYRSRQERARPGADRDRSGPVERREGARHHHRPRVRPRRDRRLPLSPSWTCPATSGSSRTCSPASAASTWSLLVVAADESVMPQTREHFDICRLLRVPAGLVALTKADLVDADTLELVRLEVRDLVAGSFLAGAPVVPVSARTGQGLDQLRAALVTQGAAARVRSAEGCGAASDRSRVLDEGLRHRRDRHARLRPHPPGRRTADRTGANGG